MTFLDNIKGHASHARAFFVTASLARLIPAPPTGTGDLSRKLAIVTGGNSGIGFETALQLAKQNATVVILCRNESRASKAVNALKEESRNQKVEYQIVDFSLLSSVEGFLEKWKEAKRAPIDILVNNAGILSSTNATTAEGLELVYATNHLTPFRLTLGLLPHLSPTARVVFLSSVIGYQSPPLKVGNGNSPDLVAKFAEGAHLGSSETTALYARSKAANMVTALELQTRLAASESTREIVVTSCHPGVVRTAIWSFVPAGTSSYINAFTSLVGISPRQGASTPLWLATHPDAVRIENRGQYFDVGTRRWLPGWVLDAKRRRELWKSWEEEAGVPANQRLA